MVIVTNENSAPRLDWGIENILNAKRNSNKNLLEINKSDTKQFKFWDFTRVQNSLRIRVLKKKRVNSELLFKHGILSDIVVKMKVHRYRLGTISIAFVTTISVKTIGTGRRTLSIYRLPVTPFSRPDRMSKITCSLLETYSSPNHGTRTTPSVTFNDTCICIKLACPSPYPDTKGIPVQLESTPKMFSH